MTLVSRFALAYPEVQFQLLVDVRNSISSPGNGILADALVSVYGAETAGSMLEVAWDGPGDGYAVKGVISSPSTNRANRSYITFLLNRRWVQSPLLSFALSESYQGLLPEKRHPLAVLNLSVPPSDVDVNVHPTKREVRFRQEDRVFSALQRAVRGFPHIYLSCAGDRLYRGTSSVRCANGPWPDLFSARRRPRPSRPGSRPPAH